MMAVMYRALLAWWILSGCIDTTGSDRESLFDTGLCVDRACTQVVDGVIEYQPRFELWASTASKRRWLQLPPGSKIDTTDMDLWRFPVGTKAWKEFTRDGVRVETRYIVKGADGWRYTAYEWNASQSDALSVPEGRVDANGTKHDIPDNRACKECHAQDRASALLGVEAIQLDFSSPKVDLADLIAMGLLTKPPTGAAPYFPLPGDTTVQRAFGYLHANCSSCHSSTSFVRDDTTLDLRLLTTKLGSVMQTPTYLTTVNVPTVTDLADGTIVIPRDPDNSVLIRVMNATTRFDRMPPLATEMIDPDGQTILRAWINSL